MRSIGAVTILVGLGCTLLLGGIAISSPALTGNPRLSAVHVAFGEMVPRGWDRMGKVDGLLSEDWYVKKTAHTISYGREVDLRYVDEVVEGLEASYSANQSFLGVTPPILPLEFYFCSMDQPASVQPKFLSRLGGMNRFAGVALGGTKICCVNLGDARHSNVYTPWQMAETARHEMNHLFAFQMQRSDRNRSWGWLFEALAHTIENTVKPTGSQMNLALMKQFMRGYKTVDASWTSLISDRNSQELEQYRDYNNLLISIIYYIQETYGRDSIARLMRNCRGKDLEDAFLATFGKGVKDLEAGWKKFYEIR